MRRFGVVLQRRRVVGAVFLLVIVVILVVILLAVCLLAIAAVHVGRLVCAVGWVAIVGEVVALSRSLIRFLSLAGPHLGLLQETPALFLLLPQLSIFDFILAD